MDIKLIFSMFLISSLFLGCNQSDSNNPKAASTPTVSTPVEQEVQEEASPSPFPSTPPTPTPAIMSNSGESPKVSIADAKANQTTQQKEWTQNLSSLIRGQWTQACQSHENSSLEVFIKFSDEDRGNQKIVSYDQPKCEGEILYYKVRTFQYHVFNYHNGVYDTLIQFDEREQGLPTSFIALIKVEENYLNYKIKGTDIIVHLARSDREEL